MEWLANGLMGLVGMIDMAKQNGAPITAESIKILKEQAAKLTALVEGMQPQ